MVARQVVQEECLIYSDRAALARGRQCYARIAQVNSVPNPP